jgi:hypothetical protein
MTPKKILYSVTCLYPIGLTLLIVFGTFSGFLNADILKILYFCNFLFFIGLLFVFIDIWRRPFDKSWKTKWTLLILLFGYVSLPVYWFYYIMKNTAHENLGDKVAELEQKVKDLENKSNNPIEPTR